jgi:hypothetical protein
MGTVTVTLVVALTICGGVAGEVANSVYDYSYKLMCHVRPIMSDRKLSETIDITASLIMKESYFGKAVLTQEISLKLFQATGRLPYLALRPAFFSPA